MWLEYIIHNGIDYGNLPHHTVEIELKQDETPELGYTDVTVKLNKEFIQDNKFRIGDIVTFVVKSEKGFSLLVDYRVNFLKGSVLKATSKDYIGFQPIFKLGAQL